MRTRILFRIGVCLGLCFSASHVQAQNFADHYEFEATLAAPYLADSSGHRDIGLNFHFPGADNSTRIVWRVDLLGPAGAVLRTWRGESALTDGAEHVGLDWYEADRANGFLPAGIYDLRLTASTVDVVTQSGAAFDTIEQRVDSALRLAGESTELQEFPIQIGHPTKPQMPAFAALQTGAQARPQAHASRISTQSVPATDSLPYTVYLGNLHSQTNHSDGGGDVSTCTGAQSPQSGAYGPSDAYQYALNEGLDILMTSEHNHLYDGSTGTNTSASPTTAHNLYQSGLKAASDFNSAHPGFLAIYGLEWGVIDNGGHMNIFNTPLLLEWEYNSSNQLIGDQYTAKSDYGSLYTLMKSNSWVGQFNHPASSGQFNINGTDLAYAADGDQVMELCEVLNTSAFSNNTTETETSNTSYQTACNKLLEAGYHVAFTSDQDNHCANWGASYTNRTGVLIPNGTALSQSSFLAAIQARHVFATMDKTAQVVLTASGGHIMGDRFSNSGSLTLTVNYASTSGHTVSNVQVYQGVPGSNGTVSQLSTTATTTVTPASGDHFYYAKLTQDDGKLLWSAPVWVTEQ